MIVSQKPPLEEAYLAHFGVKGMKWGVRKDKRFTEQQIKRTKKVATAGAIATAAILHRHGKLVSSSVAVGGAVGKGIGWVGSNVLGGALSATYFVGSMFTSPIAEVGKRMF